MRVKTDTINLVFYLFTDHLGSTNVVTDPVGGMVSLNLYKPWGESRTDAGTALTDYGFTGQRSMEGSIGLQYFNARWYDSYLNRWTSPDVIMPDPYNSLDWDRYSYVRNNPTRYNDPTGHFSEEQLEEWFGSDWQKVISENYSSEVVTILMSKDTKLGDMVTFVRDGKSYGAVFCLDEKGGLTMWDVGSKGQVSYDSVFKNDITGFYKQEAPGLFKLRTNYSDSKLPSEYRLGWNWSGGYGKYVKQSAVHSNPTLFEAISFALGTAALMEGFGPVTIAAYALTIKPWVVTEDIYQIQPYQSTYPGMPAPLAGPNEPMRTPVPPIPLNP